MVGLSVTLLGALFLVMAAIGLAARLARRLGQGTADGMEMTVVGRVALGPRQGLAAVRIADRILLVSVGDGGVRPVLELDADLPLDSVDVPGPPAPTAWPAAWPAAWSRIRGRIGTALLAAMLVGAALAGSVTGLEAQATGAQPDTQDALSTLGAALPPMQLQIGSDEGLQLSGTVGTVLVLGLLTLLPTLLLLMTSFTRVLIVLHFLRQALGTQTAPPAQMIAALALLLTGFIMAPTLGQVNELAVKPWLAGEVDEVTMMGTAAGPFRDFMAAHVRESDLSTFLDMSTGPMPETIDDVPLVTLVSAFAISELRTAFQIGFVLFLPFLVIDLVVAAVLMSLGMFMLPPVMVSLPFKLLLFVLVDGWSLIVHGIVASFG
jgi:flagellar biosynthesis protein FliP